MNFTSIGGRRFVATVGAGLATTLLQWFEHLDKGGVAYAATIGATVGAYIAGQAYETKVTGAKPTLPPKAAP